MMKAYAAALLAPSAVVLSSYGCALANSSSTYICKFETGVVVIDPVGPDGAITVEVAGQRRPYALEDEKLVPQDAGLPTLLFQPGLKRWKMLNEKGETIEITICKSIGTITH